MPKDIGSYLSAAAHLTTSALAEWREGQLVDAHVHARAALEQLHIAEAMLAQASFAAGESV